MVINVWLIGVVFLKLLFLGTIFALDKFINNPDTMITITGIVLFPIYIFWGVATWRSAQIYKGRKLWSSLTELFVILKCGSAILGLFMPVFLYGI